MNNENEILNLTNLNKKSDTPNILPAAIRAANLFNNVTTIGSIEVQLPVSGYKVQCNSISSLDEVKAKTIMGSIQMYMDHNIQLFYSSTVFPESSFVKSYDDFLDLTDADFRAIVYGVLKASYKTLNKSTFICENIDCTNPNEDKIFYSSPNINDIEITYPKGIFESPNNDYRKDSFIADLGNIKLVYKFDSIRERIELFKNKSNAEIRENIQRIKAMVPKIELIPMFIDSITIIGSNGEDDITLSDKNEIIVFISQLNSTSKEIIENTNNDYIDHITGYTPVFNSHNIECPHCKHHNNWEDIDLMVEFFLKISAIY